MQTRTCGHFSTEVELILLQHTPVVLRVPVRRCALAERMIAILSKTEEGREVASKIQLMESECQPGSDRNPHGKFRAAFGPDLEAINRVECTSERCHQSCTPGYRQVLANFGFGEEASRESGKGCLDPVSEAADPAI